MNALPKLFSDAAHATEHLRVVRQSARERAILTIRQMERALVDALDGETLKGLRDIGPGYAAARVRGKDPFEELPEPKPFEAVGRAVLVVGQSGDLEMARIDRRGAPSSVYVLPVDDTDLLAEDVEDAARVFAQLLGEHVERARKSAERFGHLEELAVRLSAALLG